MIEFLAVASSVVQATPVTVVATPVVHAVSHPTVVSTIASQVDHLKAVGPTLLAFLTGTGASVLFSLLKRDKWSADLNNVIVFVYAALIALLDAWLKGQLTVNGGITLFLLVYGSSLAWYNAHKVVYQRTGQTAGLPVTTTP